MIQVRFTVDPIRCGPLGGSVTTVTAYTVPVANMHVNCKLASSWMFSKFINDLALLLVKKGGRAQLTGKNTTTATP